MSSKGINESSPLAPWFIAAQEAGEFIGIRFGRIAPGASDPEWTFMPHVEYDGIGGFAEILRRRGARVERLPQIKYPISPSWTSLLRALPTYLSPRHPVKWGPMACSLGVGDGTQPPPAVAWHVFDEEETTQIRRTCRKASITVNSFLLKHLTKAIRPFLQDQSSVVPWMIPVNTRGKIDLERDTDVHSSYIGIRVQSYETVHDIHRNIYAELRTGEHWANWQVYKLGRFVPAGMKRLLVASPWATSQWFLGSFSNLGDWDPEETITQPECQGAWVFTPLSFRFLPVAAGCVTFQNQLSLAIQAHPSVTTDSAITKAWIQNWVKEIEIDLASSLSPPPAARIMARTSVSLQC